MKKFLFKRKRNCFQSTPAKEQLSVCVENKYKSDDV